MQSEMTLFLCVVCSEYDINSGVIAMLVTVCLDLVYCKAMALFAT